MWLEDVLSQVERRAHQTSVFHLIGQCDPPRVLKLVSSGTSNSQIVNSYALICSSGKLTIRLY
jgi:hypothetical protein